MNTGGIRYVKEVRLLRIRILKQGKGKIDIMLTPTRPGESRTQIVRGVDRERLRAVLEQGVREMRAGTQLIFPEYLPEST